MTPKRPEATCLIAERRRSPFSSRVKREGSSPPSPVLDLAPMRFMAMASVSWASRDSDPRLIAPVLKRLTISLAGSTSSSGIGLSGEAELHEAAQRGGARGLVVGLLGEQVVGLLGVARDAGAARPAVAVAVARLGPHRVLEVGDRVRVPDVALAVAPPLQDTADGQHLALGARVGAEVAAQGLGGEDLQAHPADPAGGAGEVRVDELGLEPDGLEDLRAAVGLDGGDAHLGDRLEQALADGLDDPLLGLLALEVLGQQRAVGELVEGLEHQVGVDAGGAVADQRRHVVDVARLAGLDDQARCAGACRRGRGDGGRRRRPAATASPPARARGCGPRG